MSITTLADKDIPGEVVRKLVEVSREVKKKMKIKSYRFLACLKEALYHRLRDEIV